MFSAAERKPGKGNKAHCVSAHGASPFWNGKTDRERKQTDKETVS